MCGIVGIFLKNPALEPRLGALLADMLVEMSARGPDSAGFALYRAAPMASRKLTLFHPDPGFDWNGLGERAALRFDAALLRQRANHAVLTAPAAADDIAEWLAAAAPEVVVMSAGAAIEVYKDVGLPAAVAARFGLAGMTGTHALGHTRMATESAVTTEHSHPFSLGAELCLVHNGSLSNHNRLRRVLGRAGIRFRTDNDTEVAAGYLAWRLAQGASLEQALEAALADLDGFFTFTVGTPDGFAVLRDPVACKPAVIGETDDWVAMATEYRAIAVLPGAERAAVWEPKPATVYHWSRHAA